MGHMQAYRSLTTTVDKLWPPLAIDQLRWHSHTAVADAHGHSGQAAISGDDQSTFFGHRLERVDEDVHQRALHDVLVSNDFFQATCQLEDQLYALSNRASGDEILEPLAHRADVKRRRLVSRSSQHQLERAIEAFDFARNDVEAFRHRWVDRRGRALQQASEQRAVDPDDVQHALEIVGPITCEKCERAMARRLLQQVHRTRHSTHVAQQQHAPCATEARHRTASNGKRAQPGYLDDRLVRRAVETLRVREPAAEVFKKAFECGLRVGTQHAARTVVARGNSAVRVQHDYADIAQVEFNDAGSEGLLRHALINPHKP